MIKLLQLAPRILFAIWAAGALIAFTPPAFAERLSVLEFRESHRKWIGPATVLTCMLWLSQLTVQWRLRIQKSKAAHRQREAVLRHLENLTSDEKVVLGVAIASEARTVYVQMNFPPAQSLASKGLLAMARGAGDIRRWPFVVPEFVWDELALGGNDYRQELADRGIGSDDDFARFQHSHRRSL